MGGAYRVVSGVWCRGHEWCSMSIPLETASASVFYEKDYGGRGMALCEDFWVSTTTGTHQRALSVLGWTSPKLETTMFKQLVAYRAL